MAVYIREPVYVWDVAADDSAHIQQYTYQTFEMPNGDQHETGAVHALQDSQIRDSLEECYNRKVIPVMLFLKHTEGISTAFNTAKRSLTGMRCEDRRCANG
ncbi:hypothetical protein PHYPSEUDO_006857 [Phytophthora pseudosyringae]|uniref:Uncharacterized protein n=1 Tax=Phytophthora pseudosyringae TaxID=221518 RepID=A0A8T1WDL0_9STRA|nr:hypothetical protein PHYPSEUDO_006857 [Phytophthora pseudosyringae]